jgi:hypothetical protein
MSGHGNRQLIVISVEATTGVPESRAGTKAACATAATHA